MKNINDLTKGSISKLILALALPIMGSSFLQMTYGLIDMIWIGRIGSSAVAAIGTASFFVNAGFAFNAIIVAGASIKVSHAIGSKNKDTAQEYIENSFILNIVFSLLYILGIVYFRHGLIDFFKLNDPRVESMARSYLVIAGIALIFKFSNFIYVRILNSFGESKLPFKVNTVGVLLNIILDPLFIFTFNMGVAGAAIATLISQFIVTLLFMKYSKNYFIIENYFKYNILKMKEILTLGFPRGLQRILFTAFGIIIARIIASWGPNAIAAQKIGLQIESITFMTVGGLFGATSSFIGQNYGAKNQERLIEGYKFSMKLAVAIGALTSFLFIFTPSLLIRIFVDDASTIEAGVGYLRIIGISQIFMCAEMITTGSFSGIGRPKISSTISIILTAIRIPLALFLSRESLFGLNGVWMSISISSILKGIVAPIAFNYELKKINFNKTNQESTS